MCHIHCLLLVCVREQTIGQKVSDVQLQATSCGKANSICKCTHKTQQSPSTFKQNIVWTNESCRQIKHVHTHAHTFSIPAGGKILTVEHNYMKRLVMSPSKGSKCHTESPPPALQSGQSTRPVGDGQCCCQQYNHYSGCSPR